jgi:hypothetical protein
VFPFCLDPGELGIRKAFSVVTLSATKCDTLHHGVVPDTIADARTFSGQDLGYQL